MLGLASVSSMLSTIYSRVLFCPSLRVQKKTHLYLPLHPLKSFNELVNLVRLRKHSSKHICIDSLTASHALQHAQ